VVSLSLFPPCRQHKTDQPPTQPVQKYHRSDLTATRSLPLQRRHQQPLANHGLHFGFDCLKLVFFIFIVLDPLIFVYYYYLFVAFTPSPAKLSPFFPHFGFYYLKIDFPFPLYRADPLIDF
jgi:hypothetical protein